MVRTGLVYDALYKEHCAGAGHPEARERLDAVLAGIGERVPGDRLMGIGSRAATEAEVSMCHDADYLAVARRDVDAGLGCLSTGDTNICGRSYEVALAAVGGVLNAIDAVMDGTVGRAFCAVRPPGHHATPNCGMGFCMFNNVAIAARYAQREHGLSRVVIVDWDVHHGNGTQDIFYEDSSVFYFSTHEWPHYPGTGMAFQTGSGEGKGSTLNCPFPGGSGGTEIVGAFRERLLPAMRRFRPELVLVSAGFDGKEGEDLGHFLLTDEDFADLTRIVTDVAEEYAEGRLVSVLEGGYGLPGLASSAGVHVATMAG